jgi:uncharacterized protein
VVRVSPAGASVLTEVDRELLAALSGSVAERTELLRSGSYAEIAQARWTEYVGVLGLLASRVPTILAMFLLGMWAGRTGLLSDAWAHLERWGRIRTVAWSSGCRCRSRWSRGRCCCRR